MTEEKLAHIRHAKRLNYCAKGLREFFKLHGLDYLQFVRHGIPEHLIWDTGDELARRIVLEARKERGEPVTLAPSRPMRGKI